VNTEFRKFVFYVLPLLANIGLAVYVTWQLNLIPYFQREGEFRIFAIVYAIGGLVVASSGITAFLHFIANQKGAQVLFVLSLVNTIIPTVLLLTLLRFN
jgi:hypothetical protein